MTNNQLTEIQFLILKKIGSYEKITLFFHEAPDFDALGSAYGFMEFVNDNFENKDVRIPGVSELPSEYLSTIFDPNLKKADNDFIKESLGIVFDTANNARVYTGKHKLCKETIRIDHHPQIETFCNYEWIDPISPATCQMLTDFFSRTGLTLSSRTAKYLYSGIITDTGRFLYYNTNPDTFLSTHKLVSTGFNRAEIHSAIYEKTKKQLLFSSEIYKKIKVKNRVASAVIPGRLFKKYKIDIQHSMVHLLNGIKDVDVWSTIYYDYEAKCWKGSLRSISIPINHIAQMFCGGGHRFAAGFKLNDKKEYKKVIAEVEKYLDSLKR